MILTGRYRWILAEDEPDIVGYDQALWVSELDQNADDPSSLLAVFTALRRWNLDLWSRQPEEDRDRVGIHRERGPESYGLTFRLGRRSRPDPLRSGEADARGGAHSGVLGLRVRGCGIVRAWSGRRTSQRASACSSSG